MGRHMGTICGVNCEECGLSGACGGCLETGGQPFGATCVTAECWKKGELCFHELKKRLLAALNGLGIPDMEEVTDLFALKGSFVNLEYTLPGGRRAAFWEDNRIYLGNQLPKMGSGRCYGIVADERYLLVAEYAAGGADAEIIAFQRWNWCGSCGEQQK